MRDLDNNKATERERWLERAQKIKNYRYKGYGIEKGFYGGDEYSVQVDGDDFMFSSLKESKDFIDELTKNPDYAIPKEYW